MAERNSLDSLSTYSGSGILARWAGRDNETGWQKIHEKIVSYRAENAVTIKQFLELCRLPPKSYYQQLCAVNGKNIHPSNKPGSVGRIFLDAVTMFFEVQSDCPSRDLRVDSIITDLNHDHVEELRQLGVYWLGINIEKTKVTISCSESAEEASIMVYLREAILELDQVVVEFNCLQLL
eukprot:gene25642-30970_t